MPHLRLTDFGIAIPLDEPRMTRTSMIVGSPGYMAPEQWRGADPDERADLYSVGRVGIQMLTGLRPPAEDTDVDLSAQRNGDAGHDALLDLLGRAVSRDPADRPESAAAMRAELRALDLTSRPPEPGESITVADAFGDLATIGSPTPATASMTATVGATGRTAVLPGSAPLDATRVQPVSRGAARRRRLRAWRCSWWACSSIIARAGAAAGLTTGAGGGRPAALLSLP